MSKSLVIVESPAKAKTINKYLGSDYLVRSCVGHIRDLPKSGSGRRTKDPLPEVPPEGEKYARIIRSMGINPYNSWQAKYEVLPGKEKVIQELKGLASTAKDIYLATDLDREGEAIAWNLQEVLGKDKKYKRVMFSEITQEAIQAAFAKPLELDQNKVQAQQTRRYLDRVVGYMVSPLLWKKVARGLSAGRVQSVAVKLITEREREIRRFQADEFWTMDINVESENSKPKHRFTMAVSKHKNKTYKPTSQKESDKALAELQQSKIIVKEVQQSRQKSSPPPPFITSTMQQAASTRLGFTIKRTMIAAQKLYEAGFITYIRTDSVNISSSSLEQCRAYIEDKFSKKYLPDNPRYYKGKSKQAQEAHEAIRPSNISMSVEMLPASSSIGSSERKLYQLIYTRFIASQMTDAIFHRTKIIAQAGDYELQVSGRILEFDGFSKVSPIINKDDVILPADLKQGEQLIGKDFLPEQHFTKPPARFNEASLVKELEKLAIGRPSTYSPIISTIQDRGYVRLINKKFHAEKIAEIVTDRLGDSFPNLLAYDFTASMEDTLDAIASDKENWSKVLDTFYKDFVSQLEKADSEEGMKSNTAVPTEVKCSKCSREMVIRNSSTGIFLGCSGYDDKENPCKNTINLSSVTEEVSELEEKPTVHKKECKVCGSFMNDYVVDAEHQIHICDNNPDCNGSVIEEGDFSAKAPKAEEIDCDKCDDIMEMKSGRFGKYFLCRNTECENKRRVMPNGEIAPPRMTPLETEIPCAKYPESNYVIREGALGLFLAAPGFPKQRETRSPYVKELIPYKAQLDKKFHFLMTAPQEDDEGRSFQVRYSRKTQENYVGTFNDNNRPVQQAYYEGKKWQLTEPKKTQKRIKSTTKVIKAKRNRSRNVTARKKSA